VIIIYKDDLKDIVGKIVDQLEKNMLSEIHEAVCNENLDDFQCIEEIMEIFEKNGFSCNNRHDF
jgi:hypothetical protein